VPQQDSFLAPLPGTEEQEVPTSTTFSHVNYAPADSFPVPLPGKKKTFARGVSHAHPLLCFKFCFTLFLLASFYQTHTKVSFLYSCFYLLAFSLVRMSNPEVEVRTFKQQGGESLKDAWYHISNSHHRCTFFDTNTVGKNSLLCQIFIKR
jgi:hypothetical protein